MLHSRWIDLIWRYPSIPHLAGRQGANWGRGVREMSGHVGNFALLVLGEAGRPWRRLKRRARDDGGRLRVRAAEAVVSVIVVSDEWMITAGQRWRLMTDWSASSNVPTTWLVAWRRDAQLSTKNTSKAQVSGKLNERLKEGNVDAALQR